MRIVGGEFRGRVLKAPQARDVRPTTDRVREAVFNILDHSIPEFTIAGARVLDLFAGTGALGLEALSRGAGEVLFVENAASARALIRDNAEGLGAIGRCRIWRRDAVTLGPCAPMQPFDLVFADPPYGRGLADKALAAMLDGGWLAAGAVLVLEEKAGLAIGEAPGLQVLDNRTYGDTQVEFRRFAGEAGEGLPDKPG